MKRVAVVIVILAASTVIAQARCYEDSIPRVTNKRIIVRMKSQWLECWEKRNGKWRRINSFRVTTGAQGSPTPKGNFKVSYKTKYGRNLNGDSIGFSLKFYEDFAVHGWDYNVYSQTWGPGSSQLGRIRVTAGCVQLLRRHMRHVYYWAPVGTPVIIRS